MKRLLTCAVALALSACATIDPSTQSDLQLCDQIDRPFVDSDAISQELLARNAYKPDQLAMLRSAQQVNIGMTWCDVYVIHGRPDHTNTSRYASGDRYQLVYGDSYYSFYIYMEDGQVIAAQY